MQQGGWIFSESIDSDRHVGERREDRPHDGVYPCQGMRRGMTELWFNRNAVLSRRQTAVLSARSDTGAVAKSGNRRDKSCITYMYLVLMRTLTCFGGFSFETSSELIITLQRCHVPDTTQVCPKR